MIIVASSMLDRRAHVGEIGASKNYYRALRTFRFERGSAW